MRAGDKILNYSVTRRIKAGGMGVVFEGEQTWGSRKKVAIKQLLENLRDDTDIRRRFIREAEILEMLDNPRIVKILGFDPEQDAFVMEFVEGKTLADVLKQDADAFRQPEVLVAFFASLLDAFAYAHDVVLTVNGRQEKGIVHRDIKPSNIIVQLDGSPKILDFGISRIASFQSTLTDPKLQMGSVPYMSPEQIATPVDIDWRSDIYSLGVTIWEMLTGRSPYPRVTTHEVVVEVQRQIRFEPLPSLLEALPGKKQEEGSFMSRVDQIIAKATAKDRADRYQHCADMKKDLQKALDNYLMPQTHDDETLVSAKPIVPPPPARKLVPRPEPVAKPVLPAPELVAAQLPLTPDGSFRPLVKSAPVGPDGTLLNTAPKRTWLLYLAVGLVVLIGGGVWWWQQQQAPGRPDPTPVVDTSPAVATEVTMATITTADSCYEVGNGYYTGQAGAKDFKQAAYWYERAASLGNSDGQNRLGSMYQYGLGLDQDYAQALKWFKASAEQGNAEGQKNLGYVYCFGLGTPKDYPAALKWIRASAEQGNAEGRANLGVMYEQGMGVPENNAEAMKWYLRAANQNFPHAQYYVGTMYESGKGVVRSQAKAIQWYRLAARRNDASAQQELRRLGTTW